MAQRNLGVVLEGQTIQLSVSVNPTATPPITYQWYQDGIAIPGEVGPSYTFIATKDLEGATWTVVVTNPCGEVESDPWYLEGVNIVIPPECAPYDCAAFATELFNAGWEVSDFSSLQGAEPILVPASFTYEGNPTQITPQPDKIGLSMVEAESFTSQYYLWNLEGDIDVCPGVTRGLGLGEDTVALPQGFKLFMANKPTSATTMTYGGISNTNNGNLAFWRRYDFTVNYNGGSQNRDQTLAIQYNDGQGFYSYDGSTSQFMGNPTFNAGVNLLWMETTLSNITVEDIWLGYAAQRFNADFTAKVLVNDQYFELTRNVVLGQAYRAPIFLVNDTYTNTGLFSGMTTKLYVIAGTTDPVNLEDLQRWYARNSTDYVPPAYCP